MDIYTIFYAGALETIHVDTMHHDQTCQYYSECTINESYRTLEAAVNAVASEIARSPYPSANVNVVNTTLNDENLSFGPCWIMKDGFNHMYIIVKRTLY